MNTAECCCLSWFVQLGEEHLLMCLYGRWRKRRHLCLASPCHRQLNTWLFGLEHTSKFYQREQDRAGIPEVSTKLAVKTLHVSIQDSRTQASQCKVVMHLDGSVTRCLVCPTVADVPGPALCLPDCSTTEQIHIPHIHRQHLASLCGRTLYDNVTHIFYAQFVIQWKDVH